MKKSDVNEDEEVDIMTVDNDIFFSDSDLSHEELSYLPVDIRPDVGNEDNILNGSPLSEMKYTSCPFDGNYTPFRKFILMLVI